MGEEINWSGNPNYTVNPPTNGDVVTSFGSGETDGVDIQFGSGRKGDFIVFLGRNAIASRTEGTGYIMPAWDDTNNEHNWDVNHADNTLNLKNTTY